MEQKKLSMQITCKKEWWNWLCNGTTSHKMSTKRYFGCQVLKVRSKYDKVIKGDMAARYVCCELHRC